MNDDATAESGETKTKTKRATSWLEQAVKARAAEEEKTLVVALQGMQLSHGAFMRMARDGQAQGKSFMKLAKYLGFTLSELLEEMRKNGMEPHLY
jgi:hypothetical protein